MTQNTHVVAVFGSLATDSVTRIALQEVLAASQEAGAQTSFVDLREYNLPVFDADNQDAGDAPELREQLRNADAIVLGTPMYHGSYSSPIKTALDYSGFDEFEETTVGLLAVAGGSFPKAALDHLRSVVRALDAWPLPLDVAIPDSHTQVGDAGLVNDSIRDRVNKLGTELVQYSGISQHPETASTTPPLSNAD